MRRYEIPGAALVVVRGDTVLALEGYGIARVRDWATVDPARTLFRLASVSKLFVATAVMQQLERGSIDLTADVNRYLAFQVPATWPEPVTLERLLPHTAGFDERLIGYTAPARARIGELGAHLATNHGSCSGRCFCSSARGRFWLASRGGGDGVARSARDGGRSSGSSSARLAFNVLWIAFGFGVIACSTRMLARATGIVYGVTPQFRAAAIVPCVLAALAGVMVFSAVRVWQLRGWDVPRRVLYCVVSAGAVLTVVFLVRWNYLPVVL